MIRQRALAWAAVLALVATIQIAPLPLAPRIAASGVALAQADSATDGGEPTDLAVVALHCAEAPGTEALTSFFSGGTLPPRCAPAVGVAIAVTENGAPVPGSPFTTDVAGTLAVPVGLGSAVEVREDPKSLPAGYAPLTKEANDVSYANPVRVDPAVAEAAVLFINVPGSVATTLDQGTSAAEAGEQTDLAVVALQCAAAPATEALTSFFSGGTPPSGCAPAAGVTVDVAENEKSLSGSPFRTDTDGTVAVRVGLGSAVTVKEDPKSLPSGYEPLTQEANGVPYANPVQLDAAVTGAAVLFVNVPAPVAAMLAQGAPAVDTGETIDLAQTASLDRTGCDPAYPDERTCIAPGRPLAEPCAITDQRNFTVLAPDPRRLDADGDGIGCEPSGAIAGTVIAGVRPNLSTSGGSLRRAAPVRSGDLAVSDSRVRTSVGIPDVSPVDNRADWFMQHDRNRAGLWFVAPDRTSTGNIAIVSNPIFIGNGVWYWSNRTHGDDSRWRNRPGNAGWFWPNRINVGNLTIASSGDGNVAIASNPVFIGNGLWRWPGHTHDDDWSWSDRDRDDDWMRHVRFGSGIWGWPDRIAIGNLTVACSGNGNVAVVSNAVFIGNGVWTWPNKHGKDDWFQRSTISVGNLTIASSGNSNGNVAIVSNPIFIGTGIRHWPVHFNFQNRVWLWPNRGNNGHWRAPNQIGKGVWFCPSFVSVGNLTIARSGNGNIAIVSNPIVISSGVWFVSHDRNHDDDWFDHGDRDHSGDQHGRGGDIDSDSSDVEPLTINGGESDAPPSKVEQLGASEQPTLTVNGALAVEPPPADSTQPASDGSMEPSAELVEPPSAGDAELASDGYVEAPGDGTVTSPVDTAVQPAPDAAAPDANYVAPNASSVAPTYADAGYVDPGSVAPDPGIDAAYVAPDPVVDPGYADPSYVAADPGIEPSFSVPEPTYVDPGIDAGYGWKRLADDILE